ncbi:MAG: alpha/beta fold hydrolase [Proteobacteria bacterium]|nr:alpha/beta fold hydrolase [Pseudomonadota bacterium]
MTKLPAVALWALAVLGPSAASAAATACKLPDLDRPARCGVVSVPEDPSRPHGRQLAIHYAVVSASSGAPHSDPIAVLMGGPGEDAISAAAYYTNEFQPLLDDRDLLLIDSRLTGQSAPAHCHLYSPDTPADSFRDFFPPAAVERCRRLLSKSADLTRYIYPYLSNDLERVRVALGYTQLNLFAGSYGTRAAQAFVRQYPKSVRTIYLGSPVPIDSGGPMDFARTEQGALDKTFTRCESDPDCHRAFPNVRKEFAAIVSRLDSGNVQVQIPGSAQTVRLTRGRFVEWVRSRLYRPKEAVALPWIIHRAYEGDWAPTGQGILEGVRGADEGFSWGLFFSITCTEDIPFLSESDIAENVKGTALADYRIRQQQAACRKWPRGILPEGYRNPVHSDIPTLIVTGDQDGGSPLWFTDRVAPGFTNHVTVVVHGQGHTEWNDCVAGLFEKLVRTGSVTGLEGNSCPAVKIPPFKL